MFLSIIPRLLSKAPCAILLRQQANRLQSGTLPTYRLRQTQRYHSQRRPNHDDESREEQISGFYDRVLSHFKRNEPRYENFFIGTSVLFAIWQFIYGPEPPKPKDSCPKSDMATFGYVNQIPGFW